MSKAAVKTPAKLSATKRDNMTKAYKSAMRGYLEAKYASLDPVIEVNRTVIAGEAIKASQALQIQDSPDAEQLRELLVAAVFGTIAEFFTERGYTEVSIKMENKAQVQEQAQREKLLKESEQAQMRMVLKDAVREVLLELGVVAQPPK